MSVQVAGLDGGLPHEFAAATRLVVCGRDIMRRAPLPAARRAIASPLRLLALDVIELFLESIRTLAQE